MTRSRYYAYGLGRSAADDKPPGTIEAGQRAAIAKTATGKIPTLMRRQPMKSAAIE